MTLEYLDLKKDMTVLQAINKIRKEANDKEEIYTCYVTDSHRTLHGVISVKTLLLAHTFFYAAVATLYIDPLMGYLEKEAS